MYVFDWHLQVKSMPELSDGYSIVGLSQGNMIGRALIEFCDDAPPVSSINTGLLSVSVNVFSVMIIIIVV